MVYSSGWISNYIFNKIYKVYDADVTVTNITKKCKHTNKMYHGFGTSHIIEPMANKLPG